MTWIKTVSPTEASPELKHCFEQVYALFPPEYAGGRKRCQDPFYGEKDPDTFLRVFEGASWRS